MTFELNHKEPERYSGDLLVYFIRETKGKTVPCPSKVVRRVLRPAWKNGDFTGKKGQIFFIIRLQVSKENILVKLSEVLHVGRSSCQQTFYIPPRWETEESFIVPAKV